MDMEKKTSYQLPDLGYDYGALEPIISAEIMKLHHSKHHQTYVNNLNAALEKYHEAESKNEIPGMLALQSAINFNGGGHINHSIFWAILCPPSQRTKERPEGALLAMIDRDFGSFDTLQEKLTQASVGVQGSGWGWLGYHKGEKKLKLATCANQDPLSSQGLVPLMGIDVWEHAYYLQYKNVRPDYVKAIWQLFHWDHIEERFSKATS